MKQRAKLQAMDGLIEPRNFYLLRVQGGAEVRAQKDLSRHGIESVLPMREEWRWRSRYQRGRRSGRDLREFALIPGYLAARLPDAGLWVEIGNHPLVMGVVGYGGAPRPLRPEELDRLREMQRLHAPAWKAHMDTGREFAPGDLVRAESAKAAFESVTGTVIEITGPQALVMVDFFGAPREVSFETYSLTAI